MPTQQQIQRAAVIGPMVTEAGQVVKMADAAEMLQAHVPWPLDGWPHDPREIPTNPSRRHRNTPANEYCWEEFVADWPDRKVMGGYQFYDRYFEVQATRVGCCDKGAIITMLELGPNANAASLVARKAIKPITTEEALAKLPSAPKPEEVLITPGPTPIPAWVIPEKKEVAVTADPPRKVEGPVKHANPKD